MYHECIVHPDATGDSFYSIAALLLLKYPARVLGGHFIYLFFGLIVFLRTVMSTPFRVFYHHILSF